MFVLPLLYAEIHYHLPLFFPRYYRREPEIITDVPIRICLERQTKLPILLIIKDAHLFPLKIFSLTCKITTGNQSYKTEVIIDKDYSTAYESEIYPIDIASFPADQWISTSIRINYECGGKKKTIWMDNYGTKLPYHTYIEAKSLPYPSGWFAGEPHYHSNFTNDQVEFGADIKSTKVMAQCMGLDWFFVTDHSYDLDDEEANYLKQNPEFPKWQKLKKICRELDSPKCRVIHGEEISIGNTANENVHLLAINHNPFIEGSGDSAEKWFQNKPEHSLSDIAAIQNERNLFIAAHPTEKVPLLQRWTLNRGNWQRSDYQNSNVSILQLLNGHGKVEKVLDHWKKLLLDGKKYWLVAGNDAHGNFNLMRQISIPFWKIIAEKRQLFGDYQTVFCHPKNDPIQGIKSGYTIVSNGPFFQFFLSNSNRSYHIGETFSERSASLLCEMKTTNEFGEFIEIAYFIGDYQTKKEKKIKSSAQKLSLPKSGYVRGVAKTKKKGIVISNPLWIRCT